MAEVAIGIPTYKRPDGLERLLRSLAVLNTRHSVTVIVADNDAALHQGRDVVAALKTRGYRWPLIATVVEGRGISPVRNALIDRFLASPRLEYLAMLDDDEVADPHWLDEMIEVSFAAQADVTGGRLDRRPIGALPDWAARVPYLSSKTRGVSGVVDLVDSTGNILFTRAVLTAAPKPVFDDAFALTGGEDKEALTRLKLNGARFAWAERAVVTEIIEASRATEDWVVQRSYRIGNSDMRVLLRHHRNWRYVGSETLKSVAVLALTPVSLALSLRDPAQHMSVRIRLWRALGKLAGLFGIAYQEYAVRRGGV